MKSSSDKLLGLLMASTQLKRLPNKASPTTSGNLKRGLSGVLSQLTKQGSHRSRPLRSKGLLLQVGKRAAGGHKFTVTITEQDASSAFNSREQRRS